MYRYSLDNTIAYSSDDIVLFKESPFASWMERLTLENPKHGIEPDDRPVANAAPVRCEQHQQGAVESVAWDALIKLKPTPVQPETRQLEHVVASLSSGGKVVVMVEASNDESERRKQTLAAMKRGADLIINAQLASGPLSDTATLLMRSSGFSDLGNYLYIPCDTSPVTTPHSAFRLCFLADLLHSLQGQLPTQMLIIRGDSDMVSLQVEDHIYYYRGVKQRFMTQQRSFRKHLMPDPADSSHFGRWSKCAADVLKRRAVADDSDSSREEQAAYDQPDDQVADVPVVEAEPQPVFAAGAMAAQSAPPATLRPATKGELLATPAVALAPNSAPVPALSSAECLGATETTDPNTPLVDLDTVAGHHDVEQASLPEVDRRRWPRNGQVLSAYAKKPVRPISSVLITCPQGDY